MSRELFFRRGSLCVALLAWASWADSAEVVEAAKASGVQGGIVVHVGCGDGTQTVKLRLDERYVVQGLDTSEANVQAAREHIRAAGQYGPVSARMFDGRRLPYVDNLVNLLVTDGASTVSEAEILRVLAPRGVAFVAGRKLVKPWPAALDEWTHFLHGPDNNAVAKDRVAASPRAMQWMAEPRWGRSHEELASLSAAVTAQGRLFYIVDEAPLASLRFRGQWQLVARDAFNGVLLWKRDIPVWTDHLRHFRSGPLHLPRRLVAAGERVYVTLGLGAPVTALAAATGETVRVFTGTEHTEEILVDAGVLYLAVGSSEVDRRGEGLFQRDEPAPTNFRYVAAVDAETGDVRWKHALGADEFLLPQTLATGHGAVCYQTAAGLVCRDARSGAERWRAPRPTLARRMSFSAPTLVVAAPVVLLADSAVNATDEAVATAGARLQWGVNGWNEPGFARKGKSTLRAYALETGQELWSAPCSEGYNSPVDVFVVGETVWVGADYEGFDLQTGQSRGKLPWKGDPVGMPHHRCYRNKATEQFIFTGRSGVEVVSLEQGWLGNNSWIRGTCQYGIMPANGLLYAPPNACACFGKVKTPGFFAAAPQRGTDGHLPFAPEPARHTGAAFGLPAPVPDAAAGAGDWPMYRHDAARSGAAGTAVPADLQRRWSARVGGRLTPPVIAGGMVCLAATDTHTVHALRAADGRPLWQFTAGGRIDSPPVIHAGTVLFGAADGWLYCLRAADGQLAWQFRAAPQDRLAGAENQLESVWPVHGAVLVQNGSLYATAGRSSYLDGGIVLYALDPATGQERARHVISHLDPATGRQIGKEGREVGAFDMEGVYTDVLSGDGDSVFLKHLRFDRDCQPVPEQKPHLFAVTGFLGEEWFVRSYWLISDHVGAGWSNWANASGRVPFGRILCFDGDQVYGYGRTQISGGRIGHRADAYHLYACDRAAIAEDTGATPAKRRKGKAKAAAPATERSADTGWSASRWSDPASLIVRAMVLAGDQLLVAGPPDLGQKQADLLALANEEEARAAFEGHKGVYLRHVATRDGSQRAQTALTGMPVFDGMAVARGAVFLALRDGTVECWAGP